MTDHPITPPPDLVRQWAIASPLQRSDEYWAYELYIAHHAACWGADQELEACCEWIPKACPWDAEQLRAARRPKPPSLKEQALAALSRLNSGALCTNPVTDKESIRRALEALPDV